MDKRGQTTLFIVLGIIFGLLLIAGIWFVSTYNGFINQDENVNTAWADVQSQYQRRADLIPNLVNTVQGAVDFEQETQTQIAALRSGVQSVKADIDAATTPAELQAAGDQLDSYVSQYRGLNINVENYPQLRATENFLSLQDELAGTENRIQVSRSRFNEAVKTYNVAVRRFPSNILAGMFGFGQKDFFESDAGSENAPTVDFS